MKKRIAIILTFLILALMSSSISSFALVDSSCDLNQIDKLPKNSMERYAYSKAIENHTSFEVELKKEREALSHRSSDEYIAYVTKEQQAGTIRTNIGTFRPTITTEAKVLKSRKNSKTIRVEDFGAPYASVPDANATWSGGGFNINRRDDKSARISTTGQFTINSGSITVGLDIISVTANLYAKTKTMTLSTTMSW